MVDLNKEIKLGDLFRRRGKEPGEASETAPAGEKPPKERRPLFSHAPREKKAKEPKAPKEARPPRKPRRRRSEPAVEAQPAHALPQIPLMRAFNLMPGEEAREKGSRLGVAQIVVALLGVLVFAGLAGGYLFLGAGVTTKQGEVDDLRAQLAELEVPAEAPDAGGAALAADGQARTAALSTALAGRIAWDRVLRKVSLVIPEGVWLTSLAATTPNATGGAPAPAATPAPGQASPSPNSLAVVGFATSQENVAVLLARLGSIPELTAVQLQSSTRSEGDTAGSYSFSILASVDPLGAPES